MPEYQLRQGPDKMYYYALVFDADEEAEIEAEAERRIEAEVVKKKAGRPKKVIEE